MHNQEKKGKKEKKETVAALNILILFTAINLMYCNSCSTEYIIDLMGAPGTLIPSDISGSQFQDSNNSQLSTDAIEESVAELCLALEQINGGYENKNTIGGCSSGHSSILALRSPHLGDLSQTELKQNVVSEKKNEGDISEHVEVDDVSKYIVPEVVDPQFAQNLHDLLLESATLLPSDLLCDQNSHNIHEKESAGWLLVAQTTQDLPNAFVAKDSSSPDRDAQHPAENTEVIRDLDLHGHTASAISNEDQRATEGSSVNMSGSSNGNLDKLSWSSAKTISSVIDDVAEYEIPWEDLDIGERIGLGMCLIHSPLPVRQRSTG